MIAVPSATAPGLLDDAASARLERLELLDSGRRSVSIGREHTASTCSRR